jgi:hypothetical protein
MFELILNTIRDTLQKTKQEIIVEVLRSTARDNAEIRCDLLELKQMLKAKADKTYTAAEVYAGDKPRPKEKSSFWGKGVVLK